MKCSKRYLGILSLAVVVSISGCSSTLLVKNTQHVDLSVTKIPPSEEEIISQGQKIILTPIEYNDKNDRVFTSSVYDNLSQRLLKSGNTLVDRKLAYKLKSELLAAEKSGRYRTSGPAVADIALMTKITKLSYSFSYHKRKKKKDSKGNTYYRDAYCSFTSKAQLNLRAYQMPSMALINTYEYEGKSHRSIDMRDKKCRISGETTYVILNDAIEKAIKSGSYNTLNDIAPESYVLARRDDINDLGQRVLYRINIGKKQGAVKEAVVSFYRKEKRQDVLTSKTRIEKVFIGEGEITDEIDSQGSYVFIDDEELIRNIKLGDVVTLKRGKCAFDEYQFLGSCI